MAELALGAVSLTFQVFSGCIQGYELITDAKHMPSDCQYLRVRLKTEQYRLLDWADVVKLDETDDNLLISNSSKGLLLDVLDQQRRLIVQFGRLDDKYRKLSRPLLVDYEEEHGKLGDPPAYEREEGSRTIQRSNSDFRNRFPQSEALLKKSLQWAKQSTGYPKRLKWAVFDKTKMENLALKLASFNDFMRDMLNTQQLENLAIKQTHTEFQIMQLNSTIQDLVQIFESTALLQMKKGAGRSTTRRRSKQLTNPVHAYMQARGLDDADNDDDEEEEDYDPSTQSYPSSLVRNGNNRAGLHNLAALAQFKAINSAIQDPSIFTDEFTSSIGVPRTASETLNVELSRADIHLLDDDTSESQRVEAYYQRPRSRKLSVWIEWKSYEPPPYQTNHSHSHQQQQQRGRGGKGGAGPDPKILERVKALAALLKQNNSHHNSNSSSSHTTATTNKNQFRAPNCLGYFHDKDPQTGDDRCRFGLVFEKPASVHPSTRPLSLHTLLTSSPTSPPTTSVSSVPSLTSRIALMRRLAETLERLHAVNWLHKGLRSGNILFFNDCGPEGIDLADPFVSGFDYSRPAMNDDMTEKPPENAAEDVYRHPNVQGAGGREEILPVGVGVGLGGRVSGYGERLDAGTASVAGGGGYAGVGGFKKSHDIYSLGIILLEIAYWAPIERIVGIDDLDRAKPRDTFRVRERLLHDGALGVLAFVRSHLGETVERVVRACLEGPRALGVREGADERSDEVGAQLQRGFYERVVREFEGVRI